MQSYKVEDSESEPGGLRLELSEEEATVLAWDRCSEEGREAPGRMVCGDREP